LRRFTLVVAKTLRGSLFLDTMYITHCLHSTLCMLLICS